MAVMALLSVGCGDDNEVETTADGTLEDTMQPDTLDTSAPPDVAPDTNDPNTTAPDTAELDTSVLVDTAPDTSVADTTASEVEVAPGVVTWDAVYPIFATSCAPCHAGNSATSGSSGHSIAAANKAVAYDASQLDADLFSCEGKKIGECALLRIQDGSMPASGECQDPIKPKCPDADQQVLIQKWISDGMLE